MNRKQTHTAFSQSSQLLTLCPTCSLFSHAHTQSVLELVKIQLLPYFTPEYFSTWSILLHSQNTNITLGNLTPIQSYYLIYSPYSNLFIKNYALYLVVISLQFHLIQKNSLFFMTLTFFKNAGQLFQSVPQPVGILHRRFVPIRPDPL